MAVAFRHVVASGVRYPGDIIYFAVADEEAGGVFGAGQLVEQQWDALACDYVLTEYGGTPVNTNDGMAILVTTTEKGVGNRRIIIGQFFGFIIKIAHGHGSMMFLNKIQNFVGQISMFTDNSPLFCPLYD